jgi:hypothetical protein
LSGPRGCSPHRGRWSYSSSWSGLRRQRRAATCIDGDSPVGYCSSECAACRTWYDLHNKLHEELGLKPWEWLCLPRNPYPPGTAASRNWRPDPDGEEQALWQLLDEARRCQLQHQSG